MDNGYGRGAGRGPGNFGMPTNGLTPGRHRRPGRVGRGQEALTVLNGGIETAHSAITPAAFAWMINRA